MEIFAGLRGWISQSGAPWRPYRDASPADELVFAIAGPASQASLHMTGEPHRPPTPQVAANGGAPRTSDGRGIAKSPHALITASRVNGARVICGGDEADCRVHDLSIDKKTGRIDYVLVAFSGFFGVSEKIYPLPWSLLTYDPTKDAYRVPFKVAAIRAAPSLTAEDLEWFGAGDASARAKMMESYWSHIAPPI